MHTISRFYIILALLILFPVIPAYAVDIDDEGNPSDVVGIEEADSAYYRGDYSRAIEYYNLISKEEGTSAALLYNKGNAAMKSGYYGLAMLCYERALKLDPSNSQIRNNLRFTANKVNEVNNIYQKGKLKSLDPDSVSIFRAIQQWYGGRFSSNFWAVCGLICFLLTLSGIGCYLFSSRVMIKKIGFFSSFVLLALCCLFVFFSFSAASYVNEHNEAIIMEGKVELLESAREGAKATSSPLSQGTKVRVLQEVNNSEGLWSHVRINNDFDGWVKSSAIDVI